jgi:hypothetical protein
MSGIEFIETDGLDSFDREQAEGSAGESKE